MTVPRVCSTSRRFQLEDTQSAQNYTIMAGQSKLAADEAEDSVGNFGRNSRRLVKKAWQLYKEDNTSEEAVSICKQLLNYAQLGDAHKAACHLLIAQTTHQETTSLKF